MHSWRHGENISASEVEEVIRLHPQVVDVPAIAVPDGKRIEEVKAYIVRRDDEALRPEEIIERYEERLTCFKIPRYVEFRKHLPKTPTEKITRAFQGKRRKTSHKDAGIERLT